MTDDPTRWLDDPTLSGALRADLAHGATATVTGLDTTVGLTALRSAIAAQAGATGALAPAASSSFGVKAVVGVLALGGAIGLWKATTKDAPTTPTTEVVQPVAVVDVPEPAASEEPRPAIPHEAPRVQPSVVAEPEPGPEPVEPAVAPSKRDDRRRDTVAATKPVAPGAEDSDDKYLQEAMLVARARKSLAYDAKATLELTEQIASEFPSGQLVEERRALAIRALAKLGRLDEAKERAADFLADHAKGPHAAAVRRAIGE
jgi:hypothetical protein